MERLNVNAREVSSDNVIPMPAPGNRKVPTLKELIASDPELREFLRVVRDEDMRLEALSLLEKEIKKKRN